MAALSQAPLSSRTSEAFTREMRVLRSKFATIMRSVPFQRLSRNSQMAWSTKFDAVTNKRPPPTPEMAVAELAEALATLRVASAFFIEGGQLTLEQMRQAGRIARFVRSCSPSYWCGTSAFTESAGDVDGWNQCMRNIERRGTAERSAYDRDCAPSSIAERAGMGPAPLAGLGQNTIAVTASDVREAESKLTTGQGLLTAAVVGAAVLIPLYLLARHEARTMGALGRSAAGWSTRAPKLTSERRRLKTGCGTKCFLMPATMGFPVCRKCSKTACSCALDCGGARAAFSRARQTGREPVARAAVCRARKAGCKWAQRSGSGKASLVRC